MSPNPLVLPLALPLHNPVLYIGIPYALAQHIEYDLRTRKATTDIGLSVPRPCVTSTNTHLLIHGLHVAGGQVPGHAGDDDQGDATAAGGPPCHIPICTHKHVVRVWRGAEDGVEMCLWRTSRAVLHAGQPWVTDTHAGPLRSAPNKST